MNTEELLRRTLHVVNGLQGLVGHELDDDNTDADFRVWAEAENLRMQINNELNTSPDLLWLMMKQRGAVQMQERVADGTDFVWPYQHRDDTHDRPYDLESLTASLLKVGLKVDERFVLEGRGWGRWYVRVNTR